MQQGYTVYFPNDVTEYNAIFVGPDKRVIFVWDIENTWTSKGTMDLVLVYEVGIC